ncbi:MAG: hypothetical protein ABH834_04065 [Candidatus Altiarchaeota archaeon]
MKTLVAFYSRTGNTRRLAQALAAKLAADTDEITIPDNRSGILGFLKAGRESMLKKTPRINASSKNPSDYDVVVVGTPVWGSNLASPVRTYLRQNKGRIRKTAFFCTMNSSGSEKVFTDMEEESGLHPKAALAVAEKQLSDGSFESEAEEFASKLS